MEVRGQFMLVDFFSFYHVGPGSQVQVVKLGSKHLYPLRDTSVSILYSLSWLHLELTKIQVTEYTCERLFLINQLKCEDSP